MILDISTNHSADIHWVTQLCKLHQRLDLIRSATAKAGGVYLYANQQGCDGGRLYYDGCACICLNGNLIAQVCTCQPSVPAGPACAGLTKPTSIFWMWACRSCIAARPSCLGPLTPCQNCDPTLQGRQFSVREVEVVTATVDIDEVVSYRGAISSLQEQASNHRPIPHITVPFRLCHPTSHLQLPSSPIEAQYRTPEEEIALGERQMPPPLFKWCTVV